MNQFPLPPFMDPRVVGAGLNPAGGQGRTSWSANGELVGGNDTKRAALQAIFQEAGTYTVQVSVNDPNPGVPPVDPRRTIIAIEWRVAGNVNRRQITVGTGASISGNAEAIAVDVFDATAGASWAGRVYNAAISVSKGIRPVTSVPPTFDEGLGLQALPPAGGFQHNVPQGIGVNSVQILVASVLGGPIPDNAVQVTQQNALTALNRYDPRYNDFVALVPGCTAVSIANRTVGQDMVYAIVWGVDG